MRSTNQMRTIDTHRIQFTQSHRIRPQPTLRQTGRPTGRETVGYGSGTTSPRDVAQGGQPDGAAGISCWDQLLGTVLLCCCMV